MSIYVYRLNFVNSHTDDAAVRANIAGIAPHSGPIVELPVVDNQRVKEGDLLFVETYIPSIKPGMEVEVYLLTYPGRPFRGVGQGIGWVNHPDDGATVGVLPEVRNTLNRVRLANRFPVRILLEERDAERPFRMGTTAVVPIRGFPAQAAPAAPAR